MERTTSTLSDFEEIILHRVNAALKRIRLLDEPKQIIILNKLHRLIHEHSPFSNEPVNCIQWVHSDLVQANDYNPNIVAPPEMKLLEHSIREDGYTQPIVGWMVNDHYEVVDGFHRNMIGKECDDIYERIKGYLPLTIINPDREKRRDRIASTIRHNRARGKHHVEGMSDIVIELKKRNWTEKRISKELGMDEDEVLRLCQISGLIDVFADSDFSTAWDSGIFDDEDIEGDIITEGMLGNE